MWLKASSWDSNRYAVSRVQNYNKIDEINAWDDMEDADKTLKEAEFLERGETILKKTLIKSSKIQRKRTGILFKFAL